MLNLPLPVLILNGSKSSDDFRIVSWKWTRSGSGLAAGTVILGSDTQPVLMVRFTDRSENVTFWPS